MAQHSSRTRRTAPWWRRAYWRLYRYVGQHRNPKNPIPTQDVPRFETARWLTFEDPNGHERWAKRRDHFAEAMEAALIDGRRTLECAG